MRYEPNTKDPRVLKRIRAAYAYTLANFSDKESPHSMLAITKKFGQAQTDLSQWLMRTLLTCTDTHYSNAASLSMKYVINIEGALLIDQLLHGSLDKVFSKAEIEDINKGSLQNTVVTAMYAEDFKDELATGDFEYKDQSERLWHPIQNIKKDYKRNLLGKQGYRHEYDIECCAPTLLYQEALNCGLSAQPMIEHYISNKEVVREVLSEALGITTKTVKMIVNALFAGAKLGKNPNFSLYNELDGNDALIVKLQGNEYICALRESIRLMWQALPISDRRKSKIKWDLYFRLERKVLDAVKKFMRSTNNKCFTEHDGWTCAYEIDEHRLCRFVRETTGYTICLSHIALNDACELARELTESN